MNWATRVGCHVDRSATAWLIKRFVDQDARFLFLDRDEPCPPDATPFDVPGADLSHHGDRCTFESAIERYQLVDPGLDRLARVVHDADLEDARFDEPAAAGLSATFSGLALTHGDSETLTIGFAIFDGLYALARRGEITPAGP